eukprot:5853707-Prymnesium_polylepis.1
MAGERSSSTTGPLAPSLRDQVVNHVTVVGRVTGPLAPSRQARPGSRDAKALHKAQQDSCPKALS